MPENVTGPDAGKWREVERIGEYRVGYALVFGREQPAVLKPQAGSVQEAVVGLHGSPWSDISEAKLYAAYLAVREA